METPIRDEETGMTVSKQALREALAEVEGEWTPSVDDLTVITAARFTERLLPGGCECWCHRGNGGPHRDECSPICTGQVWDEGLKDVIANAMHDAPFEGCAKYEQMQVVAVLAALAGEVER